MPTIAEASVAAPIARSGRQACRSRHHRDPAPRTRPRVSGLRAIHAGERLPQARRAGRRQPRDGGAHPGRDHRRREILHLGSSRGSPTKARRAELQRVSVDGLKPAPPAAAAGAPPRPRSRRESADQRPRASVDELDAHRLDLDLRDLAMLPHRWRTRTLSPVITLPCTTARWPDDARGTKSCARPS